MFQYNLYLLNYLNLFIVSFRTKILSPVGCKQHPLRRNSDAFRRFLFECSWKTKLIIICFEIKFASSFILNQYFQLCLNSGRPRCVLPSSPQTVVFRFCRFRTMISWNILFGDQYSVPDNLGRCAFLCENIRVFSFHSIISVRFYFLFCNSIPVSTVASISYSFIF